jgi:menaquinone-specific isochorismate synthase
MLNYFDLLSSILDNNPNRLLISPNENKIVASFGESRSIKRESFDTYSNFKQEVLKILSIEKIGFGSLSFDLSNNIDEEIWGEFPIAEFIFPSYSIIFENNNIKEFGSGKNYYENIFNNKESIIENNQSNRNLTECHEKWINLVEKAKRDISKSKLQKIVVGESKKHKNIKIDIKQTLIKMAKQYPDCVTFLYKNKNDYFFGATPEKVFAYRKKSLSTDALAGSIPNYGQNRKEIEEKFNNSTLQEEHKIVVKFLETQLKKLSSNKINKSNLKIKSLSNINHLLLELETITENNDFFEFIKLLHPSPALAGYPVKEAKQWIKQNELFHRGLYSGSIGYIEEDSSYFFAALRCAKYSKNSNQIITFAGNGIVENSKIKHEINELDSKFDAINKSIIEE